MSKSSEPFVLDIPVKEMYFSTAFTEALGRLEFACHKHWFATLTGECGSGISTAIRCLAGKLDSKRFRVLYLADSQLTPKHLYNELL